jgi:hypothetical protein
VPVAELSVVWPELVPEIQALGQVEQMETAQGVLLLPLAGLRMDFDLLVGYYLVPYFINLPNESHRFLSIFSVYLNFGPPVLHQALIGRLSSCLF